MTDVSRRLLVAPNDSKEGPSRVPRRMTSLAAQVTTPHHAAVDPDEYFVKYTVAEVKAVLHRLRSDADAKQEELRLMVGERYRDLLQASASIIAISKSSQRVLEALEDMNETVSIDERTLRRATRHRTSPSTDDAHLQVMQSLAAHLKLLLDASEHLWRLLERKRHLQAAWLFLLSRVVYRSLLREDSEDGQSWDHFGINVLEQFPLVQRQWDTVSQFRTQIAHKATLSLREHAMMAEEVCASLLALHLLDSLPLTDALVIFLKQRYRALQALNALPVNSSSSKQPLESGGHPGDKSTETSRRRAVRPVLQGVHQLLEAIAHTVGTARQVFQDGAGGVASMMGQALMFIQNDSPSPKPSTLPQDLQLTTQTLLTTLPASTHLLLLPPSIRSYKPFVDLDSSSSSISQQILSQKIGDWFKDATVCLHMSAAHWFEGLESLKDVWEVRTSIFLWLSTTSGPSEGEKSHLVSLIDDLCRRRIEKIWKLALQSLNDTFKANLLTMVSNVREGLDSSEADIAPISYLLSMPIIPSVSQMGISSAMAISSFEKYKDAIRKRMDGRTPFIDQIIFNAESAALKLRQELEVAARDKMIGSALVESYTPDADSTSTYLMDLLKASVDVDESDPDVAMRKAVFIGRAARALSLSSFLTHLGCQPSAASSFHSRAHSLYGIALERWQSRTVVVAMDNFLKGFAAPSPSSLLKSLSTRPSPPLMESLLMLVYALQRWGIFSDLDQNVILADALLQRFIEGLCDAWQKVHTVPHAQLLWDLSFLKLMGEQWGPTWAAVCEQVDNTVSRVKQTTSPTVTPRADMESLKRGVAEYLPQVLHLIAPLLPPQHAFSKTLTPLGRSNRATQQTFSGLRGGDSGIPPAMDLVKPHPRFGLLLIGSSNSR